MVDEYGTEFRQPQKTGRVTFTLGRLVRFLDYCRASAVPHGIIMAARSCRFEYGDGVTEGAGR